MLPSFILEMKITQINIFLAMLSGKKMGGVKE